jgi:hypothetical protein
LRFWAEDTKHKLIDICEFDFRHEVEAKTQDEANERAARYVLSHMIAYGNDAACRQMAKDDAKIKK